MKSFKHIVGIVRISGLAMGAAMSVLAYAQTDNQDMFPDSDSSYLKAAPLSMLHGIDLCVSGRLRFDNFFSNV